VLRLRPRYKLIIVGDGAFLEITMQGSSIEHFNDEWRHVA
jgi:uncharacterized protein with von Willebrand factor type A (vWA) domain